ncbi:MAG: hypothetical protein ACODAA_01010 [Gemmatimonadota bacterium]
MTSIRAGCRDFRGSAGARPPRSAPLAALALAVVVSAACGGRPPLPDRPQPVAYADTLPIREPAEREVVEVERLVRIAASGEVGNAIGLRGLVGERREALNVDRFDDVVNSAWFEHRNGRDRMSPRDVRVGPTSTDGPADGPLTIVAAKVEGISPGYTVRDIRGDRYVLKFDPKGYPYLSSAAGVISNRLLYAAGYHVPEDYLFRFHPDRLRVDPDATVTGEDFVERPLTLQVARDALARTDSLPDGSYVAVASKFVPGVPKGPFYFEGRRDDDPNDHYEHEHRRELRGLKVVSAWLNHVDMRFMNTLDSYVEPGYLRHYLIDFAATLGSGTIRPHEPREGLEYNFDLWDTVGRILTLGFYRVGWEGAEWTPIHPTIGWLRGEAFEPERWKPNWPNQAFSNLTTRDGYWGARLVGSFTDEQIRAAVAAGELPDRWAADTLATILRTRRDAVVEHWYGQVSPVENPLVLSTGDGTLAIRLEDIGLRDGPWTYEGTRYEWKFDDPRTGESRRGADIAGRFEHAVTVMPLGSKLVESEGPTVPLGTRPAAPDDRGAAAPDHYATLDVRIVREGSGVEPRPARVYLRWSGDRYEVAGLEH